MSHTPGPWEWEYPGLLSADNGDHIIWTDNVPGGDEKTWAESLGSYGAHAEDNAEANARLIAATPRLLKNLEIAIHRIQTGDKWTEDLQAAVAEATGAG